MTIYKITNLLNGKIYVGQTKQKIEQRFLQHSKANSPLGQAMRQCGLENFTVEVIENCKTQAELNEREKFWPFGYNRTDGGGGFQKITKNISKNLPQKIFTTEDRKNIVEDILLKIFWAKKIFHSELRRNCGNKKFN